MSGGVGLAVVAGLLLVLPVAAVWLAGRWRDPPPERWGPSERDVRLAAADPLLARHRLRAELGLLDDRRWNAARRAVARGAVAPPDLRAATRVLAERRIARIDGVLLRRGHLLVVVLAPLASSAFAALFLLLGDNPIGVLYSLYFIGLAVVQSPPVLRRRRARAAAALAANPLSSDRGGTAT